MKVMAIDYGRKRIGIALGIAGVVETRPLIEERGEKVFSSIKKIVAEEEINLLVVGVSQGKMAEETKRFAKKLATELILPVKLVDETLTSQEAKQLKKQGPFDSVAAALILERFFQKRRGVNV